MKTRLELLVSVIEKANEDPEFRDSVLADAKAAIGREFGVAFPERVNIVVHENELDTVHLPLPAKPMVLDEGQLSQVSGGECSCGPPEHCGGPPD